MESQKVSSDGEDNIPSDFFDDFNKDEFMEGLSVIDSWDDEEKKRKSSRARINAEALDSVRDLRELIAQEGKRESWNIKSSRYRRKSDQESPPRSREFKRSHSPDRLDNFIKPGSRRDPNKTNEAIKKDKETKVKEYLAKHLESSDDLRPPGTELDDYFEDAKVKQTKSPLKQEHEEHSSSKPKERRLSPIKYKYESPVRRREFSPRHQRPKYLHSPHRSPHRGRYSPRHGPRRSPHRSDRRMPRYSPRRTRSPEYRRERRSRSPYKRQQRRSRSPYKRSRSRSRTSRDDFLYPSSYTVPEFSSIKSNAYQVESQAPYVEPVPVEYSGPSGPYPYMQGPTYSGYGAPYEYGTPPVQPMVMQLPQPVPAPVIPPISSSPMVLNSTPAMVPPPQQIVPPPVQMPETTKNTPFDALAKLVADGKLSHEDYLKLAPNKGATQNMDINARVAVLNRCNNVLSTLGTKLVLPNRLLINNSLIGPEPKSIAPKFCSPLKRRASIEFHFTKYDESTTAKQNKQIVESLLVQLGMDKVVGRPKKKGQKNMKDAAVQTTKPFCDVCEIRAATKHENIGTSVDHDHFSQTVHTQVLEEDLYNSKAVFNPSGGISDGAPISIAHMTPAQLVSQLAARAKTLKQDPGPSSSNQFRGNRGYDYDGRGDNQYRNNYNNYRY